MKFSGTASHLEIEAKLLVRTEHDLATIAALRRIGPFRILPAESARLHSVYLDTSRLRLARHAVALRLRRKRRHWEVTAKWAGRVAGVVHERAEMTFPLDGAPVMPFRLPPGPLHERLAPLVGRAWLRPILVTDLHRRTFHVLRQAAGRHAQPLAELALDRVALKHPGERGCRTSYREIEIELMRGSRADLDALVRLLGQHIDLTPSPESKFARGVALLYPRLVIGSQQETRTRRSTRRATA
jgi:triphosphatase